MSVCVFIAAGVRVAAAPEMTMRATVLVGGLLVRVVPQIEIRSAVAVTVQWADRRLHAERSKLNQQHDQQAGPRPPAGAGAQRSEPNKR
jgi:hypothetical protein